MNCQKDIRVGHIVASIARLQANMADRCMEHIGLYRGQAFLLMILSREDGMNHSEIASRLEISPGAVTKVIKRLESAGYLERRADPTDERISRVFLREEGQNITHQIETAFDQIDQTLLVDLSPIEKEELTGLLKREYASLMSKAPNLR